MSPLSRFLRSQLELREESPESFAARSGVSMANVYRILRGEVTSPRQETMQRIAAAFNMDVAELHQRINPHTVDPVEQSILEMVPLMREAVKGIPRSMWATVISKTLSAAVEQTAQIADALAVIADERGVLEARPVPPVSVDFHPSNTTVTLGGEDLAASYHAPRQRATPRRDVTALVRSPLASPVVRL